MGIEENFCGFGDVGIESRVLFEDMLRLDVCLGSFLFIIRPYSCHSPQFGKSVPIVHASPSRVTC